MNELAMYIGLGALLLAAAAFLLRPAAAKPGARGRGGEAAEFFPVHCRYFPQVLRAFTSEDAQYIAGRAPSAVRRQWESRRRQAARMYLAALREDFARLNRLSRLLALHAASISASREAEMFWLNLRFQILYAVVSCRLSLGWSAADDVRHIASLIGRLGSQLEHAALAVNPPAGALAP